MSILATFALAGAIGLLVGAALRLFGIWGTRNPREIPETVKTELSDKDKEKVKETQELIHEKFGDDVVDSLRKASNKQRVDMMDEFARELALLYGLDIEIDITVDKITSCGYYTYDQKKAVFNIAMLMIDGDHENFADCVYEVLDTIVHELRHAVQHKAVSDPTFWDIGEERAKTWDDNMKNYIRPNVDPRGYARQPVEADAVTFAGQVLSEVK